LRRPELGLRLGAEGREGLGARLALGARDGADGRDTCGRDGIDGRRFADGLGADRVGADGRRVADGLGVERLGVDGRADGLEERDGVVRRSSVGVVRRTGAALGELEDDRFGNTLRVGAAWRLVVSDRLGVTRRDVGSVWRCGVASRCGVPRLGVTARRPAASGWL
jgi:hypothetical protein